MAARTRITDGSVNAAELACDTPPADATGLVVRIAGTVATTGGSGGGSSDGLTNTQLRASPVPVSGTVAVTGPLTDAQLRAAAVPVSGTVGVSGTVPVSGPLTDAQLRAAAVPVSGTFWQATQPVSGTVTANAGSGTMAVSGPLTDAQLRATAVAVSGPLTDAQLRATAVPVSLQSLPALAAGTANIGDVDVLTLPALPAGNNNIGDVDVLTLPALPAGNNNIGDVDVVTLPALTAQAAASSNPIGTVSLGNSLGKTNVLKTGALTTTATTADQVILTYTVAASKTFYLEYFDVIARLTTFAATATLFGSVSLESPAGTKLYTTDIFHAGNMQPLQMTFAEPIPIAAGTVIRVVCTPSATTSFAWKANFGGYEK